MVFLPGHGRARTAGGRTDEVVLAMPFAPPNKIIQKLEMKANKIHFT